MVGWLIVWSADGLSGWVVDSLAGWMFSYIWFDWTIGLSWLIDVCVCVCVGWFNWLCDWLIWAELIEWFIDLIDLLDLSGWLIACLFWMTDWLIVRLIGWLVDSLIGWLYLIRFVDWLCDCFDDVDAFYVLADCPDCVDWLSEWLSDCLIWFIGWWFDWWIGWSVDRLIDWLTCWNCNLLNGRFAGWLIDCLIDLCCSLIEWLIDRLIGWEV